MSTHYKDQTAYPIANSPKHAVHVLKGSNVKAAIVRSDNYEVSSTEIMDKETSDISKWWTSTQQPKKEFTSPGQVTYVVDNASIEKLKRQGLQTQLLDLASIKAELNAAALQISPEALSDLHQKMLNVIADFSDIFQKYMNVKNEDFVMRVWQIFAPKGVLGRTPFLHIDHSVLTGMWYPYASRSPAQIYTGDVPENVWDALQPNKQGKKRGVVSKKDRQNSLLLKDFTQKSSPKDLMTMPDGALIIAKNLKNRSNKPIFRNLSDENVRQSICLHKSGDVPKMGQAGLIMIPQILSK